MLARRAAARLESPEKFKAASSAQYLLASKWSYQNPERVVKYLNHPPIRTDLGKEGLYSQDLTLFELHAEDAAEMVRLGLSFYDLRTSQYSSDEEHGPDYFIIGAPKSAEVLANSELSFEIRCVA